MSEVIGGEYEMFLPSNKVQCNLGPYNAGKLYSSGRAALYYIILSIRQERNDICKIYIPDYICDSVIETLNVVNINWQVYHLNDDLTINQNNFDKLDLTSSAVLLVNYFGLSEMQSEIAYVRSKNKDVIIIEDNVQSFFSMFCDSDSNYKFTSFRKSLPLPDGGWVVSKHPLLDSNKEENTFSQYKIAGSILKNMRHSGYYGDKIYLNLFEQGEKLIDDNLTKSISRFTLNSLPNMIDCNRNGTLRRRNAEFLVSRLMEFGIAPILPLGDDHIPLFIPIRLKNREKIRNAMFAENIFCPIHWPFTDTFTNEFTLGKILANEELSLIVDYRYTTRDMNRIVNVIINNI